MRERYPLSCELLPKTLAMSLPRLIYPQVLYIGGGQARQYGPGDIRVAVGTILVIRFLTSMTGNKRAGIYPGLRPDIDVQCRIEMPEEISFDEVDGEVIVFVPDDLRKELNP